LPHLHRTALALAATSLAAAAAFWRPAPVAAQAGPDPSTVAFYTQKVQPILQTNCYRCHAGINHRGGLSMDTHASILKGGHDGIVVVPGHADQSLLVKLIRHDYAMDPGRRRDAA
jgi:cytochrome c